MLGFHTPSLCLRPPVPPQSTNPLTLPHSLPPCAEPCGRGPASHPAARDAPPLSADAWSASVLPGCQGLLVLAHPWRTTAALSARLGVPAWSQYRLIQHMWSRLCNLLLSLVRGWISLLRVRPMALFATHRHECLPRTLMPRTCPPLPPPAADAHCWWQIAAAATLAAPHPCPVALLLDQDFYRAAQPAAAQLSLQGLINTGHQQVGPAPCSISLFWCSSAVPWNFFVH